MQQYFAGGIDSPNIVKANWIKFNTGQWQSNKNTGYLYSFSLLGLATHDSQHVTDFRARPSPSIPLHAYVGKSFWTCG